MAVAASKSFSASLLTLFLLAWYLADNYNIRSRRKTSIFKALLDLPTEIEAVFKQEAKLKKIAKEIAKKDNFLVIGRKYLFPIALEGAHKLKETAYIHAEGLAAEELRHGAEAMLDKDYVVIALVPGDELYAENLVVLKELKKIGVSTLILSEKTTKELKGLASYLLPIKRSDDLLDPFFSLLLLQLLAYYLAETKGIDTDKPRHIGKFVA
jgi:glucosamine--fructose-6-phosphate aminotransferase (isomerizing)